MNIFAIRPSSGSNVDRSLRLFWEEYVVVPVAGNHITRL